MPPHLVLPQKTLADEPLSTAFASVGLNASVLALVNPIGCRVGQVQVTCCAHHRQFRQAKVVDVRPGRGKALAARLHFTPVFHHQMLLEHVEVFEGAEA